MAIAHTALFAISLADDNRTCPVEAAVNRYINEALDSAQEALRQLLGEKRLSEIARDAAFVNAGRNGNIVLRGHRPFCS